MIEGTALLIYAILIAEVVYVGMRNKNKAKKVDLLEMPYEEKMRLIKAIKENLRAKAAEAKLWQSLLNAENLTINGEIIQSEENLSKRSLQFF
jgi:hypothetical protein